MIDIISSTQFLLIVLLAIIAGLVYLLFTSAFYKTELDEKNFRLIQLYLDTKFICKLILQSVNTSDGVKFCRKLMREVVEYYNLEDIIIVDSIRSPSDSTNTPLRMKLVQEVSQNLQKIELSLQKVALLRYSVKIDHEPYMLYISSLSPDRVNDGLIICIERMPSLLTEQELYALENCLNLLKTRLIYD